MMQVTADARPSDTPLRGNIWQEGLNTCRLKIHSAKPNECQDYTHQLRELLRFIEHTSVGVNPAENIWKVADVDPKQFVSVSLKAFNKCVKYWDWAAREATFKRDTEAMSHALFLLAQNIVYKTCLERLAPAELRFRIWCGFASFEGVHKKDEVAKTLSELGEGKPDGGEIRTILSNFSKRIKANVEDSIDSSFASPEGRMWRPRKSAGAHLKAT